AGGGGVAIFHSPATAGGPERCVMRPPRRPNHTTGAPNAAFCGHPDDPPTPPGPRTLRHAATQTANAELYGKNRDFAVQLSVRHWRGRKDQRSRSMGWWPPSPGTGGAAEVSVRRGRRRYGR